MKKDIKTVFIPGKTRIKYGGAVVDKKELSAIDSVLKRNWWTLDEQGRLFEKELAKATSVNYAIFTNSGSSALLLSILALNLPKGSEVIVPSVNFPTLVTAILVSGLIPVYVDVESESLCIDLEAAKKAITKKTKALVVVNIAGNTVDIKKLDYFKKKKIFTVLDNCDGYGTTYKNKPVESYFDISATSFHAAHIITTGEGGGVFTDNKSFYDRARSMREWGRADDSDNSKIAKKSGLPLDYPGRYTYINLGFNLKPIELQAAMGRIQLKKLKYIKQERYKNFNYLKEQIEKHNLPLNVSKEPDLTYVSWFACPITIIKPNLRGKLRSFLEKRNIETRVIFAGSIVYQPGYKNHKHRVAGKLTNSKKVLFDSFFVSAHPTITKQMLDYIVTSLSEFFTTAGSK